MPVSRPTPAYLQSTWHPPTTTHTTYTELTPHTSTVSTPSTVTQYYTEQQVIVVPVSRTHKVRRPTRVWREEEVTVDEWPGEDEEDSGAEQKTATHQWRQLSGAEEKQADDDVVLDIDDTPLSVGSSHSASSLFSLVQPLTAVSGAPSVSSSPSAASLLSRYNPRIINGYLDRRRPHSRRLLAVPNESLPPPPFVPPAYPLSTRAAASGTHFEEKEAFSPSGITSEHALTIDLSCLTPSASTSTFLSQLPSHLSSASSPHWSDPTSLVSSGLQLRDTVNLPRGSPRTLSQGCVVYSVEQDSRAWKAGVQCGDSIVSVEGREVRNEEECVKLVNRVCGSVQLLVRRDGELVELSM